MSIDEADQLLGLKGNRAPDAVVKAFRNAVIHVHPDRAGDVNSEIKRVLEERVAQLTMARDVLLAAAERRGSYGDNDRSAGGGADHGGSGLADALAAIEGCIRRREFVRGLSLLDEVERRHGIADATRFLRLHLHATAEQWPHALAIAEQLANNPEHGQDSEFLDSLATLALNAEQPTRGIAAIQEAHRLAGRRVPGFVDTEARLRIALGQTAAADRLIDELRRIDPSNDLITAREQVFRVGDSYVGKRDTAQGACCICAILELVFDCL